MRFPNLKCEALFLIETLNSPTSERRSLSLQFRLLNYSISELQYPQLTQAWGLHFFPCGSRSDRRQFKAFHIQHSIETESDFSSSTFN